MHSSKLQRLYNFTLQMLFSITAMVSFVTLIKLTRNQTPGKNSVSLFRFSFIHCLIVVMVT